MDQIVLVAALTAAVLSSPAPAPSSNAQASPAPALKTIASVRASARCADIITHANSAIDKTLDNDRVITQTITALRITDLDDSNSIHRRNNLNALGDLAKTLMLQSRSGDDEVKRLRDLAKKTKDPAEAQALKEFADELGGALWRQQKIARDVNGFLAYVDFRDMTQWSEADKNVNTAVFGVQDPLAETPTDFSDTRGGITSTRYGSGMWRPRPPMLGHDPSDPTPGQQAKWAADDFQKRIPDIVVDESHAASQVDTALTGC
jgi:hypothetical protein